MRIIAKIAIIGVGKNGEAFAHKLLPLGHEIYLLNRTPQRAYGVMEDLIDGYPHCRDKVHVCERYDEKVMSTDMAFVLVKGDYEYSDFKALTDLRTKGLPRDGYLLNNVATNLQGYGGYVIIVSNPVDLNGKQVMVRAGLSPNKVIAYGTNLDTWRGQNETARRLDISLDPVADNRGKLTLMYAGEHGDNAFGLWSTAKYGGKLLTEMGVDKQFMQEVDNYVRRRGVEVILKKYDTTIVTVQPLPELVEWIMSSDENHIIPSSVFDERNEIFYGQPVAKVGDIFVLHMPSDLSNMERRNLEEAIKQIKGKESFAESLYVDRQIRNILYLDDVAQTLGAVKGQLKAMARMDPEFNQYNSLNVHTARTTREAKEILYKLNVDVLIIDEVLRGDEDIDSGLDFVVNEVLPNHPFTVPVMLSGQASEDVLKKAIGPKFGGYIEKTFDVENPEHWAIIKKALAKTEEKIID